LRVNAPREREGRGWCCDFGGIEGYERDKAGSDVSIMI